MMRFRFFTHRWLRGALLFAFLVTSGVTYAVVRPACGPVAAADAIVVLGAKVWEDGQPSPALRGRAIYGAELLLAGWAPVLVPTGGLGQWPPTEAEAIAELAERIGVPEDRIVLEPTAHSTLDSAVAVAALAKQHGWKSVIVVSDWYHVTRAAWMFADQGLRVQTACASDAAYERSTLVYQTLRELGSIAVYAARRDWF